VLVLIDKCGVLDLNYTENEILRPAGETNKKHQDRNGRLVREPINFAEPQKMRKAGVLGVHLAEEQE
jgi:hypothetical protein